MMKTAKCRYCNAEIGFIKMISGKTCPVDAASVYFIPGIGDDLFVLPDGTTRRGMRVEEETNSSMIGFVSHFATCSDPDKARKPRKSDRKKG